jgi:hypothetical protein
VGWVVGSVVGSRWDGRGVGGVSGMVGAVGAMSGGMVGGVGEMVAETWNFVWGL